jgi:hypothetical protein
MSSHQHRANTMKRYAELGTVYRNQPCIEYPGQWVVYCNGEEAGQHPIFQEAYSQAGEVWDKATLNDNRVSICWQCSENDPRIGEVWYTGFYQHGSFDSFGRYKS